MKKVLSKCIICKTVQGKTLLPPSTTTLPEYRLYFEYPFKNVGLDYASPLFTRDIFGKSRETFKPCIIIFACAATRRNTHLELVPSESSDLLLLAIRKGSPRAFISDNFKTFKSKEIKHLILTLNIKWKFVFKKSPWWGGFYERIIGIKKRCIKKVVGKALLNYDELTTLLAEIEQTLNSRPMTYLSDEHNHEAITPSHLLYGRNKSKRNIMHIDYSTVENTQQHYKRVKFIINHFKNRFYEEYILALRERHQYDVRKFNNDSKLCVNDVVLIQGENQPRVKW